MGYREFNLRLHRGRFHDVIRILDLLDRHGERSYVIGSIVESLPQLLSRLEELEARMEALERGRTHSVENVHNHNRNHDQDPSPDLDPNSRNGNDRESPGVVESSSSVESALSSLWQG